MVNLRTCYKHRPFRQRNTVSLVIITLQKDNNVIPTSVIKHVCGDDRMKGLKQAGITSYLNCSLTLTLSHILFNQ